MSQLLPYFAVAFLLLAVSALWARQILATRKSNIEVVLPRKTRTGGGSASSDEELGETIFAPHDWDFVSRDTSSEIQRMFRRERTTLAISWIRRTRNRVSAIMRAHVGAVREIEIQSVHLPTEMRLALSYLVFLILCNFLIGLIWVCGPVRTSRGVGQTLRSVAWLRTHLDNSLKGLTLQASKGSARTSIREIRSS